MFRPKKKRIMTGIPSSSLADIAFVLLFFFLSTTKFDQKYGLGIVLPAPSTEDTQRVKLDDKLLTRIQVTSEGTVAIGEEILSLTELERRVRGIVADNPQMIFMLRTHRQSKYIHMVDVLDRLRLAGATRINLSTN